MSSSLSLENYLSLSEVVNECKNQGLYVKPLSLKWRLVNNKFSCIRDQNDIRKRLLVPREELPNIIAYYSELKDHKGGNYHSLTALARELGLKERSLYPRAEKLGAQKVGDKWFIPERDYQKWKLIFQRRRKRKKDYVSTGEIAKEFGTSHHMIVYHIKQGEIPATVLEKQYFVSRQEFEAHKDEWRQRVGYLVDSKTT
jgi:biotin operon repressor